jgi:hypothetical protein
MATNVITPQSHTNAARRFLDAVTGVGDLFYVFASNHLPATDELNVEPILESDALYTSTYDNILWGKEVVNTDVNLVIPKIIWTSGETYDTYDDTVAPTDETRFYVASQDGTSYNVYKCLKNGAPSTVAPSGTDLDPIESPVDGYVWKFMYTIDENNWAKFATTSFMPVLENEEVRAAAVPQSVEVIKINDTGAGYSNYVTGAFRLSDLRIGNDTSYAIKDDASAIDDYYQGCIIKMTTGPAAGQYRTIVNYGIVNSKKTITLDSAFSSPPGATDEYEIYPAVLVASTYSGAQVAKARAIISSSGNTVSSVEVLETGKLHRTATASVYYHPSVNIVREADLTPIVSPSAGHGGDVINELGARFACVSVQFSPTDTVLPHTNGFRTIGILKNPTFENVKVFIDQSQTAGFVSEEDVLQYKPVATLGTVSVTGNVVTGTSTTFDNQLAIGDKVLVANGSYTDVLTISSVSSNTVAQASNDAIIPISGTGYRISVTAQGLTDDVSSGAITLEQLTNKIVEGGFLYGDTSKATATVKTSNSTFNAILLNNRDANEFKSFIQLTTMTGSVVTGTFVEDEKIYQQPILPGTDPTAYLHSIDANNGIIYASNISNIFELNKPVLGDTSQAQFNLSYKYNGDLTVDSGEIIYVENILTVSRVDNKSETVKLILEF